MEGEILPLLMLHRTDDLRTRARAKKGISLILAVCLLAGDANAALPLKPALQTPPSISIPSEFGDVQAFRPGTSGKTVIYIQDAHDVLQAQENIAAIITHLVDNQSVKTVYEEGFEGPVPTDALFRSVADPELKRRVSYYFLDQLKIGGAEYAHLNRTRDFKLLGADSFKDHFENVDWYAKTVQTQTDVETDLSAAEKELQNLTKALGLKPLQNFQRVKKRFEENKTDFVTYLREVCRLYLESFPGEDLQASYPAVTRMLRAIDTRQAALLDSVNQQREAAEIFSEMNRLEDALAEALLKNSRDRQLYEYYKAVRLLRRLNKIEVTPAEYQSSKQILDSFRAQDLADFLAREGKKMIVLPRRWEESLQSARGFYETALRRDEKIQEAMRAFVEISDEKTAVLVYGGFHKERILSIFEDLGLGYEVVAPRVTDIESRHREAYREGMSAGTGVLSPGLAAGMARLITLFEMEHAGKPETRERIADEIKLIEKIMRNVPGDLPSAAKEAALRLRQAGESREFTKAAASVAFRSELRSSQEVSERDLHEEPGEADDPERRADKIVSKLIKHWYRGKSRGMSPAIEALKDRTLRAHPMGTSEYLRAAREFDDGLLTILDESVAAEAQRLSELKALTTDLFIYHAGIERELVTKEGRKAFRERFGSDVPDFPVQPGDSFKAGELTPVFAELIANIRHVDPTGAMFFYRLDQDPRYVQYVIRDGGALTSRAQGVQRSIMGEEYPDQFGRLRKHGYHNAIDAVIRRSLGGEVIVQYDKKSERYFSGWLASQPWFRSLNGWMREHFTLPLFGIEGEIIGRPWLETGVSKIKHKQGLKVKLLMPRQRSELRVFEAFAQDYLLDSMKEQEKLFYHETAAQAQARYDSVQKEVEAVWMILDAARNADADWNPMDVSPLLEIFKNSLLFEMDERRLAHWIASDAGVTLRWIQIKGRVEYGVNQALNAWRDAHPEIPEMRISSARHRIHGLYQRLYTDGFTKSSLANVVFRLDGVLLSYRRSKVVREWNEKDTANVFEISRQYVGVETSGLPRHKVRVTISNPRRNADIFPYLTAEMSQSLAAAFLEDIKDVNDLLKRWPLLSLQNKFSISYKKTAVVSLISALLSLVFGPAAGKVGLALELLMWGTAAVIWMDVFQIKTRTKNRIDFFADMIQEQSGSWTVIPADEGESARSELRADSSEASGIRTWIERELDYVRDVMTYTRGIQIDAARNLGISRSTLSRYLKANLPGADFKGEAPLDLKLLTLVKLKRAYVIASLIFYGSSQRAVSRETGIDHRAISRLVEEHEFDLLRRESPEFLLQKFNEEVKLAFSQEEIKGLLAKRFDPARNAEPIKKMERLLDVDSGRMAEIWTLADLIRRRENENARAGIFQSEKDFRAATEIFKQRIKAGETGDSLFVEAAAVFKAAARFKIGQYPSDEQVAAAIAIHRGSAIEKEPGEGKTLSIALAAYVNALTGRPAHIHTFNSYLAGRDAQSMGPVFDLLGMSVSVIMDSDHHYLFDPVARGPRPPGKRHLAAHYKDPSGTRLPLRRKEVYKADIVYGVKDLFVFDFLFDQTRKRQDHKVQSSEGASIVILDEGDGTLLDESGYPLIVAYPDPLASGQLRKSEYVMLYQAALALKENSDYTVNEASQTVDLHRHGLASAIHYLKYLNFDTLKLTGLMREHELGNLLRQALMTRHFNERDGDYILRGGKIQLVDEFTGRIKSQHVLGNHRHQFIAAKETYEGHAAELLEPTLHGGLITYQNYYRMIQRRSRFSIITGTMGNDAPEIEATYGLQYVSIPKQVPSRLLEHSPVVTRTKAEKDRLVIEKIVELHVRGNPVLVFVKRISDAHALSRQIEEEKGLEAAIIDGLDLDQEIHAVANAGKKGQITIATSVAGRGVNIKIGDDVKNLGGLAVIMTRKSRSRRIDDQAKLRAARRGDPGEVYWFLSEEDEFFRLFGEQSRSEEILRHDRRQILFYDDELDPYRAFFYEARNLLLELADNQRQWMREKMLTVVDIAWQRYLTGLEHAMYRREPEGYLIQVRDGFRFVQEALENAAILSGGEDAFQSLKKKTPLLLNGHHDSRSELRVIQNRMEQYSAYPETLKAEALGLEDALIKARTWVRAPEALARQTMTLVRHIQQGGQGMNLTAIHTPGPFKVLAVRSNGGVKADEIYHAELDSRDESAFDAIVRYLQAAYPGKTFDVESGVGVLPSGTQDVVMITVSGESGRVETVPPAGMRQMIHSARAVSASETYNQITGQSPADAPKLLVTKFRSLDPKDQDRKRSELRSEGLPEVPDSEAFGKASALTEFYEPTNQPGAAMIDFRDLVTFTPEEIREAAVVMSQRTEVRFVIHDVSPENEKLLYFKGLFKSFSHVVWTRSSGNEAFNSLGPKFKEKGVVAFARKSRDLSGFTSEALKTIRFFAVAQERPGTFAAALSYDPEQRLFQTGVVREGAFYIVQPLLADLASRYLTQFAFAASA